MQKQFTIGDPCVMELPTPCNEYLPTGRLCKMIQEEFPVYVCNDLRHNDV